MKDELRREVLWLFESLKAAAKVYWIKRRGRGMTVKRAVVAGAQEMEAEEKAHEAVAETAMQATPLRIVKSRKENNKREAAYWREVLLYLAYVDEFYNDPRKPDVTVVDD